MILFPAEQKLIEKLYERLLPDPEKPMWCPREEKIILRAFERYKRGDVAFAAILLKRWIQFLAAGGYMDGLWDTLTKRQWKRYGVIYKDNRAVKSGKWVVYDSHVKALDNSFVAAFGKSWVSCADTSTIVLYNEANGIVKDGSALCFQDSQISVTGEGHVQMFDRSAMVYSTRLTYVTYYDEAELPPNFAGQACSGTTLKRSQQSSAQGIS